MIEAKRLAPVVLFGLGALLIAGCGGGESGRGAATETRAGAATETRAGAATETRAGAPDLGSPADGGTLTVLVGRDVRSFIEWPAVSSVELELIGLVMRPLAELDPATGEHVPVLAESWEIEDGGRALTFRIRDNAVWEDGTPVTSRDVAFTFERQRDPDLAWVWAGDKRRIVRVETPDERTARFVFDAPYVESLHDAALGFVYPAHLLEGMAPSEMAGSPFAKAPVGTGPYRLARRETDVGLEFVASETHFAGRPHLDRVVVRVIPDAKTRAILFEQGDADLLWMADDETYDRLEGDERFRGVEVPNRTFLYITWNTSRPELSDARVRRALAMALDRESMRGLVLGEHGGVCEGPVAPGSWAHVTDLPAPAFDLEGAKALLEESGWADADGDGVRERDGAPLSFTLAFAGSAPVVQDTATLVRTRLAPLGVEVRVQRREPAVFRDELADGRFQAVLLNERQADKVDLPAYGHSRELDGGTNTARWFDPEFDAACDAAAGAATREEALPHWRRAQEIMAREQPYTFLYYRPRLHLVSARVRGAEIGPRGLFASVGAWWIPPGERRR